MLRYCEFEATVGIKSKQRLRKSLYFNLCTLVSSLRYHYILTMNLFAMNWEPYYSVSVLLGLLYTQPSADWDGPNFAIQFGDKV